MINLSKGLQKVDLLSQRAKTFSIFTEKNQTIIYQTSGQSRRLLTNCTLVYASSIAIFLLHKCVSPHAEL